ncbi:MAG: phage tail protein [Burkholderiaceae bacterium]|nr:phage tail protein [Burkholderiaceae bacterium]
MGLHMVFCQGPVDAVQQLTMGDRTVWGDASRAVLPANYGLGRQSVNLPDLFGGEAREGGIVGDFDVLGGDAAQGRNDYLQSLLGAAIPAFRGVVSVIARRIYFAANNPYIKPIALRLRRYGAGWTGTVWIPGSVQVVKGGNAVGMNPAHILVQCLTDPGWGMGYPLSSIGASFADAAGSLAFEGFGLNLLWTRQQPIETFIGTVLDHIGAILYTNLETGQFEVKLLRQDMVLQTLDEASIVSVEQFDRAQWGELANEVTVVYTDWDSGGSASLTVSNTASINLQGGVINARRDYPGVSDPDLAARLALRDLRALGYPLARITFNVPESVFYQTPRPGDVYKVVWPRLSIASITVRVVSIARAEAGSALLRIEALEDVFSLGETALASPPPPPPPPPLPQAVAPALVVAAEVPYYELARTLTRADLAYLDDTDAYLGALASAGPASGQLNWRVYTGASSSALSDVSAGEYAPLLTLSAALPATEADATVAVALLSHPERLDVGDTAYLVDVSGTPRELVGIVAFDAAGGTATLSRGLLDTVPVAHAAGAWLIGNTGWGVADSAEHAPGETVFVAAQPRTSSSAGALAYASNANPMTLVGRQAMPYPPGRVRINGLTDPAQISPADDLVIAWAHRDRLQQTAYLVRQDETDIGPEPGMTYTLRILDASNTVLHTASSLTGNSYTLSAATASEITGLLTIEIFSVRAGWASYTTQRRTVLRSVTGYGFVYGQSYGGI